MNFFETMEREVVELHRRYTELFIEELRRMGDLQALTIDPPLDGDGIAPISDEIPPAEPSQPLPDARLLEAAERLFAPTRRRAVWDETETRQLQAGLRRSLVPHELVTWVPTKTLSQIRSKVKRVRQQEQEPISLERRR
jgi:hypothetical protein